MIKTFLNSFIVFETLLLLVSYLVVEKVEYLQITFRALIFSFFSSLLIFYKDKINKYINFYLLVLFLLVLIISYFFSSFENLKKLDVILGVENLSYKISLKEISFLNKIGIPEFYERVLLPDESLEIKVLEFRNNSIVFEKEIHNLVNKVRAEFGLKILKWDENLSIIARYHSKDMAINDYFDHISPNGETLKDRFLKFNFSCRIIVENYVYEGAENLFMGYIYSKYYYDRLSGKIIKYEFKSLEELTKEIVEGWLNSEGHRKNLLFEYWKSEGIGVYVTDEGKIYITQVFC